MEVQRVAVVTGGANGIGRCIAEEFRKQNVKVYVIDKAEGDHYVGDISDKSVLEAFADTVIRENGGIDYLVNNALPLMKGIDACSYEEFQHALAVGVTAPAVFPGRRIDRQYFLIQGPDEPAADRELYGGQGRHCRTDACTGSQPCRKSPGEFHFPRVDRHGIPGL